MLGITQPLDQLGVSTHPPPPPFTLAPSSPYGTLTYVTVLPPHQSTRDLTEVLQTIGARDGRLIHLEHTPARSARYADWPSWTDPDLIAAYRHYGIDRPWTHQVEASSHLHSGRHTVIATGTGSGKSLAAWLPVLSDILAAQPLGIATAHISDYGKRPTALYLSPTKALAADQFASLSALIGYLGTSQRSVRAGICDGDTPLPERNWARSYADILLTNPDFLHFSLLPGHERWTRLLRSLRYVIIDECHAYRGLLGAHVALVIRRLLRLVRRLSPHTPPPTVLCVSATTGEPALTAARLIGTEASNIAAVTDDGSPAGEYTLALWQPALRDPWISPAWEDSASKDEEDPSARRSAVIEAAEVLVDLMSVGARALVFVRSRRSAEVVAEHARHVLGLSMPALAPTVRAYRGGYLPEERRALEADLRRGKLRALATTNALELGIDVTGLDAVLIAGWPGTRASMMQQAGRAGRAGSRGVAVLIASDNPLDAYLVHHPEDVFAAPEATVFDPTNPYVLAPHLCAAASESPLREEDLAAFGLSDESFLEELAARGALRRRPSGWFWNTSLPGRAHDLTSLRGDGPPDVPVVDAATGTVVGTVTGASADSTVHPGAVYVHQGRTYIVEELTDEAAVVRQTAGVGYRTRTREECSIRILGEHACEEWARGIRWCVGSVEVTNQVIAYTKHALPGMEVISQHLLSLPERTMATTAVWWTIPADVLEQAGVAPADIPGALHAAEHASIGMLPLLATCDRWDLGGLSTAVHPQTMMPTVFVHDGQAGGTGFAERGYRAGRRWLTRTLEVIEQCPCLSGCPSCVQSPKCGNNNELLDKAAATTVLRLLLEAAPSPTTCI